MLRRSRANVIWTTEAWLYEHGPSTLNKHRSGKKVANADLWKKVDAQLASQAELEFRCPPSAPHIQRQKKAKAAAGVFGGPLSATFSPIPTEHCLMRSQRNRQRETLAFARRLAEHATEARQATYHHCSAWGCGRPTIAATGTGFDHFIAAITFSTRRGTVRSSMPRIARLNCSLTSTAATHLDQGTQTKPGDDRKDCRNRPHAAVRRPLRARHGLEVPPGQGQGPHRHRSTPQGTGIAAERILSVFLGCMR